MDDTCAVCADSLEWVAYGRCGHKDVCSTCVARLRFICNDRRCCICKSDSSIIFVTKALGDYTKMISDFSVFPSENKECRFGTYMYHEDTQSYFDDLDHYNMIKAMCRLSCSVCDKMEDNSRNKSKRKASFRDINQLKGHLFHQHKLMMCSLCLEGRKVFICEQKLYSKAQLEQHIHTGDSEVDGTESERGGFQGHPLCEFCRTPFYGDNELYRHMNTEHFKCHICERRNPGKYEYFKNYDELEIHFRKEHFLCEDEACLTKKFIVFQTEAEMKVHNAQEHGGRMSRSKHNAVLQLPTSFTYRRNNEHDNRRGRRNTFLRDLPESELSRAIEANLETSNSNSRFLEASSSKGPVLSNNNINGIIPLVQPVEDCQIKVRIGWTILTKMKSKMTPSIEAKFRKTCFGNFLDVQATVCESNILFGIAQHQVDRNNPQDGLGYKIGQQEILFTPKQFCLVTGLRFGVSEWVPNRHPHSFRRRFFGANDLRKVKLKEVDDLFQDDWSKFDEDDCVRICILMMIELCFKGTQKKTGFVDSKIIDVVDDFEVCNNYPWGSYFWEELWPNLYNMHRRKKDDAKGFGLPGFVWAFKIWIFEMFPEFRTRHNYYLREAIPRFLSWGPCKKFQKGTVDKMLSDAAKHVEYHPLPFLLPTVAEMLCDWYIASAKFLDAQRAQSLVADAMQNHPHVVNDVTQNYPHNPAGDMHKVNDGHFGSDQSGYDMDTGDCHMKKRKLAALGPSGTFVVNEDDDSQSTLKSIIKELLEENNKKLFQIFMEAQKSVSSNSSKQKEDVREAPKEYMGDEFLNLGNRYRPETNHLEQTDDKLDDTDKAQVLELRRSKQSIKPAPCMLSPFTVINQIPKNKLISKDEDDKIKAIRYWYPKNLLRKCPLTGGNILPREFWSALLADDGSGWLSSEHIFGWTLYLYQSRVPTDRWSILSPFFQLGLINPLSTSTFGDMYDGSSEPFPSIRDVDEVYVPLNVKGLHWLLGVFNLPKKTLTVYDSLSGSPLMATESREIICHINFAFDRWLRVHNYYEEQHPNNFSFPFNTVYPPNVPQQKGVYGDCGVWVCTFLDRLINKQPISQDEDPIQHAHEMRRRLAILFYENILENDVPVGTSLKESQDDDFEML